MWTTRGQGHRRASESAQISTARWAGLRGPSSGSSGLRSDQPPIANISIRGRFAEVADPAANDAALREAMAAVWRVRDDRYSEERTEATSSSLPRLEMFAMGG